MNKLIKTTCEASATILFMFCLTLFLYTATGFNFSLLSVAFQKNAGANYSVPNDVIKCYILATKNNIHDFNLSKRITENPLISQRVVEFLYPIRLTENSTYVFSTIEEVPEKNSHILDTLNGIVIYEFER